MKLHLILISRSNLQNDILSRVLSDTYGYSTDCSRNLSLIELSAFDREKDNYLVLWDCHSNGEEQLWDIISERAAFSSTHPIALLNACRDFAIEKKAMNHGLKGVFYEDDDLSTVVKGIEAIRNKELWYSRKSLSNYLLSASARKIEPHQQNDDALRLSSREKEILRHLTAGASNKDIAEKMCISHYTVKSHLANIYRKISVSNRIQATIWSSKHLD